MALKCSVKHCNVKSLAEMAIVDDGQKLMLLCPDHQKEFALSALMPAELETYPSQYGSNECEICISEACYYADEIELHLCEKHLKKLILRSLSTLEYKMLLERHGEFKLISEDYYARGGYALQPL